MGILDGFIDSTAGLVISGVGLGGNLWLPFGSEQL